MNLTLLYYKLSNFESRSTSEEIRNIRKYIYKMTQVEFADLIGIKFETLRNWEKGKCKPSSAGNVALLIARDHKNIFLTKRKEMLNYLQNY